MRFLKLTIIIALLGFNSLAFTANSNLKEIVKAEHVEELSQKIATLYIYVHKRMNIAYSEKEFKKSKLLLDKEINGFVVNSNPEIEGLVEFMKFTNDELQLILKEPFSKENAAFIIDYSESLMEAAEGMKSISLQKISMTKELQMMLKLHEMENLVERANRYYIAYNVGLRDDNNLNQMVGTLKKFTDDLKYINTYKYPAKYVTSLNRINRLWKSSEKFFKKIEENSLPRVVLSTTTYLLKVLDELAIFHEQNIKNK